MLSRNTTYTPVPVGISDRRPSRNARTDTKPANPFRWSPARVKPSTSFIVLR